MSQRSPSDPEGMKLITVSFDEENGIEVDWTGMSSYECWALLSFAVDIVRERLEEKEDD